MARNGSPQDPVENFVPSDGESQQDQGLTTLSAIPPGLPSITLVGDGDTATPKQTEYSEPLDDLSTSDYYEPISAGGDGTMPFWAAVHWIATQGLQISLLIAEASSLYRAAAIALRDKIISNKVKVYGENSDRDFEEMPGIAFVGREFCFDFEEGLEVLASRENRIEISSGKDGDCLFRAYSFRAIWTKIVVCREDVRREWPLVSVAGTNLGLGKLPLIKQYLRENFPSGVPDPAMEPRKGLKGKIETSGLATKYPQLQSIDIGTLKSAIDEFNEEFQKT
jgi:hypothetical protein